MGQTNGRGHKIRVNVQTVPNEYPAYPQNLCGQLPGLGKNYMHSLKIKLIKPQSSLFSIFVQVNESSKQLLSVLLGDVETTVERCKHWSTTRTNHRKLETYSSQNSTDQNFRILFYHMPALLPSPPLCHVVSAVSDPGQPARPKGEITTQRNQQIPAVVATWWIHRSSI